ncbi:MAG: type II toxin-antitoxin system RelE/ParE family toxin [Ewingella sp.]|uniref:type II toxin-antitoxin system RelE/ParE family toxin n=1 Tax=Ewingella TaxID=41201 RepID=UPI00336578A1
MQLVWKPMALEDRERIFDWLSAQNVQAAIALDDEFDLFSERVCIDPLIYRECRVAGLREAVIRPNYIMIYQIRDVELHIVRIIHTAQRWP